MATLNIFNDQVDPHELQCSSCDVIFYVVWNYDGFTTRIEYCPFCGEEFEVKEHTP